MVDEFIFRTMKPGNRLILELTARGGMRIGENLKLAPNDIEDRKLTLQLKNGDACVPKRHFDVQAWVTRFPRLRKAMNLTF